MWIHGDFKVSAETWLAVCFKRRDYWSSPLAALDRSQNFFLGQFCYLFLYGISQAKRNRPTFHKDGIMADIELNGSNIHPPFKSEHVEINCKVSGTSFAWTVKMRWSTRLRDSVRPKTRGSFSVIRNRAWWKSWLLQALYRWAVPPWWITDDPWRQRRSLHSGEFLHCWKGSGKCPMRENWLECPCLG